MVSLYVTSFSNGTGKTAICAVIGSHLISSGKKTGYFKPVTGSSQPDPDADFIKEILSIPEPLDTISPATSDTATIKAAFQKVSAGMDVVLIEGLDSSVGEMVGAKVLVIANYVDIANIPEAAKKFKNLAGFIINKVPVSQLKNMRSETIASLKNAGVNVFGTLPEDKSLMTFSVSELASLVEGKILNNPEKGQELIENFMLGAMTVDSGLTYFERKANKAAIVHFDRPDMQMAALATSTRALVLYGDANPNLAAPVQNHAALKKIPVIVTKLDANEITARIEKRLSSEKFDEKTKLPRLITMMSQSIDYPALYKAAGIA